MIRAILVKSAIHFPHRVMWQKINKCVRKYLHLWLKSQRYKKPLDIKPKGQRSTTTPRVHFSNKHPITGSHSVTCESGVPRVYICFHHRYEAKQQQINFKLQDKNLLSSVCQDFGTLFTLMPIWRQRLLLLRFVKLIYFQNLS